MAENQSKPKVTRQQHRSLPKTSGPLCSSCIRDPERVILAAASLRNGTSGHSRTQPRNRMHPRKIPWTMPKKRSTRLCLEVVQVELLLLWMEDLRVLVYDINRWGRYDESKVLTCR